MSWQPCACPRNHRCERCFADTLAAVATHVRGYAIAEHIARTRPHLIGVPRFDDLPWPPGYDFAKLARHWVSEVDDERALAILVPELLAYAREGWERSPAINNIRTGRMTMARWRRQVEQQSRGGRRGR